MRSSILTASLSAFFPSLALVLAVPAYRAEASPPPAEALSRMLGFAHQFGPRAAFVFDLDETTVDSSPRHYEAMLDAIDEACNRGAPKSPDCEPLRFIKLEDFYRLRNRYDDLAYLRHYGAKDEAFVEAVAKRALEIYLSGRYIVDKDRLYPGASLFLRRLKKEGALVYFVSSRSIERQGPGTLRFLAEHGVLRPGEDSLVYLKPDAEASADFKRRATREIADRVAKRGGRVFGIFENEPENLEIWMGNFPRALPFFVVGAYVKEGPVARRAVILQDFRMPR